MSDQDQPKTAAKTASQTLAELVARRKAQAGADWAGALQKGHRQAERAAAARSASKSKPALRK